MTMQAIPRSGYKQQPRRIPRSLGFARYALSFDGVDDYVEIPGSTSLDTPDALTVEAWIYEKDTTINHSINKDGATRIWIIRRQDNTRVVWHIWNSDGILKMFTPPNSWAFNEWFHIVCTAKVIAGNIEMGVFFNGESRGTTSFTGTAIAVDTGVPILIGRDVKHKTQLVGGIRVYGNRALTPEEVKWNMLNYHNPIRSGLVLWLPMEEGAGEIVYDKSGYGNNGTLLPVGAGPTWERLRQWELRAAVE